MAEASRGAEVTAAIALHQGAGHIREAVESVIAQTVRPRELIVVDDGSTDGGADLVGSAPFPVRILRQDNAGQGAARNAAIAAADTRYVALLDQDDLWYPEHLATLLAATVPDDPQLAWIVSDFDEMREGEITVAGYVATRGTTFPHTARSALGQSVNALPSASLFRREHVLSVGGFDTRLRGYEDDDLFVRLLRAGRSHRFVPVATTAYRLHADNTSRSPAFLTSRLTYARTLLAAAEEDGDSGARELVLRRFLTSTLVDYSDAVSDRRWDRAGLLADSFAQLRGPDGAGRLGWLLRHPRTARAALRVSSAVPAVRDRLPEGLEWGRHHR